MLLAGGLFGLSHLALPLALGGRDAGAIIVDNVTLALIPWGWHLVLWWLYARYDSLAAPTLLHLALNLSGELL